MSARSLSDLVDATGALDLPLPGEPRRASEGAVFAVRQAVAGALAEPSFLVECVRAELARPQNAAAVAGLVPFATSGDERLKLAFGFWAPHTGTGPHEHVEWTVTAVVHNRLDVTTYHYRAMADEGRLVRKNHFSAERGRAGQIHEPCIHAPENPTDVWSLTLHVLGPNEDGTLGERRPSLTTFETPAPSPHEGERRWHEARALDQQHAVLIDTLATLDHPEATALLEELASYAAAPTRRAARRALAAPGETNAGPPELALDTVMVERLSLPLRVREDGAAVTLRLGEAGDAPVLLRTPRKASAALQYVAETPALRARDLPGPLSDADRLTLGRALLAVGLYHPEAP